MKKIKIIRKFDVNKNMVYYKDNISETETKYNENNEIVYTSYTSKLFQTSTTVKYEGEFKKHYIKLKSASEAEKESILTYDKNNNLIHKKDSTGYELNKIYKDNKLINSEDTDNCICDYEYDNRGNEIYCKSKIIDHDTEYIIECITEYDNRNNVILSKVYENGKLKQHTVYKYEYLEDSYHRVHVINITDNTEYWKLKDNKNNVLHYIDSNNKEYWNEFYDNKIIYRTKDGYEKITTKNERGDIISIKDNKNIDIEYVYEDEYLQ